MSVSEAVSERIREHVAEAVSLLLPAVNSAHGTVAEGVNALLWPFVAACVQAQSDCAPADAIPGAGDRRSRPWQYVVRFWLMLEAGPELVAETDPLIMRSTGELPRIITDLGAQMHESDPPEELNIERIKALLPQFRNNLGRGNGSTLRVPYTDASNGDAYMCQVDVLRLGE